MIGQAVSHYQITGKLGAGGMGEVYRARDGRLNRDVAIKVLPEGFAQDAERLARFQREAQVLASLNHPNIAAIYGFELSETTCALVLELVEGATLAERLQQGPIPVDESLAIARQITEALEAAHERGIIHRDLKPANIKVTPDGTVKILDFGLAKIFEERAAETELSHSPTLIRGTQAGVILGTAAYMSPEQAQGKVVDKRCDIWSFGVVLYEMLTGRRLFKGETVSDTLAAVLRDEVNWQPLPAETPAAIRRLLKRCLERDRRQRLRDIGEARIAIETASKPTSETETIQAAASTGRRRRVWLPGAVVIAIIAAAAAAFIGMWLRPVNPDLPLRKSFLLARGLVADILQRPAISPDGKKIVYMANGKLWLQELGLYQARELPGTEGPRRPFWSPDSEWVAFGGNDGRLRKVSVRDGTVSVICHTIGTFGIGAGGAWLTGDRIVFSTGSAGLFQVSPQGGEPTSYLDINEETDSDFHEASPLPDGRGVIFLRHRKGGTIDQIEILADGKRKLVFSMEGEGLQFPVYSTTGHILFQRITGNPGIWALPFSLQRLEATGEPFLVAPGAFPSVSTDGTLLVVRPEATAKQLGWVNRKGEVSRLLSSSMQSPEGPAVSPDGRKVAISIYEGGIWEVFVLDGERSTRVTFADRKVKLTPAWSPDGRYVFFSQLNPDQIWKVPADGSGKAQLLVDGYRPYVSPDGRFLVFQLRGVGKNLSDIVYTALANPDAAIEPASVRTIVEGPGDDAQAVVSPDGRYMAYQTDESGGYQIYVRRFPDGEGKWQVSVAGGAFPRWSRDGRELFFSDLSTNDLMVVPVQLGANITLGSPQRLFSANAIGAELTVGFDVSPDGKEFVVVLNGASSGTEKGISIVQNWFAEFKSR